MLHHQCRCWSKCRVGTPGCVRFAGLRAQGEWLCCEKGARASSWNPPVLTEPAWCFPAPAGTWRHLRYLLQVTVTAQGPGERRVLMGSCSCLPSGAKLASLKSSKCHQLLVQVLHSQTLRRAQKQQLFALRSDGGGSAAWSRDVWDWPDPELWDGSVLLAAPVGAGMGGEVGSRSFYSAVTVNVTLCAMAQHSTKAQACAGTSL